MLDAAHLHAAVQQASWASVAVGFTTGFLFSFNPVALASIPVSLAYVTKSHNRRLAVQYAAAFVVGMLLVHAVLGGIAALGGIWVAHLVGRYWGLVLGPLLIVLVRSARRLPWPSAPCARRHWSCCWGWPPAWARFRSGSVS